ncbi:hypothetical protein ELH21_01005 [Rhizobium leguminosarum]|uniref:hypothetical protein n=1 Tax=Rhizobium leguminosarum TaxID=384 RepID=UPI0010312F43|nr:hypothetical protein [Rhizobium leguminosarum]TBD03075.1 hypothetical protein ELH21_01005 [Rhizobium leguminosarum]
MIPPWASLEPWDRDTFRATIAFLNKRLPEQGTIDWALRLNPEQRVERVAIEDLLNGPRAIDLQEPWATAWRLIEESWSSAHSERDDGTAIYGIRKRLRGGDRSGAVIATIVNLVAPRLKVEPIGAWRWQFIRKPRSPKSFDDILSASLTSGDLIDLSLLDLANLTDIQFLKSLAGALEAAILRGLDIARRLGWDGQRRLWQLGGLERVYYVTSAPQADESKDPDAYHQGIAPSVKLLHSVLARIADLDPGAARPLISRWSPVDSPVHVRLWAAMSRNSHLTSAEQVGSFLLEIDDRKFWDLHAFPEIAELRALRFGDLDQKSQQAIAEHIQKGPPRAHWPKKAEAAKVKSARLYWAVRELRRIEVAGGQLPASSKSWLTAQIPHFADLNAITIDEGFLEAATVRSVPRNPDDRYNTLEGAPRLRALETALSTSRGGWDDDPAERANDWLQQPEKAALVLSDFEATGNGGDDFPRVWNRFGWAHSPKPPEPAGAAPRDLPGEAARVLALLNQLSEGTLSQAIEGISAWLDAWEKQIVVTPLGLPVWLRVWPIAVEASNTRPESSDDSDLSVTARTIDDDREPTDLDTLNTPAGKLVGVFLAACPTLTAGSQAFAVGSVERQMRDVVIAATGRSGLIARHRLIEALPYFLRADPDWTQEHLITPLLNDDGASLALWRAIARRTHFTNVLEIIGGAMAERATDRRLGRETRRRLVFSIVIESLHAFREGRASAVPNSRIQQMLRTLDDEVRASAANTLQQFVRDLSRKVPEEGQPEGEEPTDATSAAALFRSAAAPFLREVWPQERSLATPGVSGALADLPATSKEAFAEAVDIVSRFLVPFECWSMLDYGFFGEEGGARKLTLINDETKAKALLQLLDLTVGTSEGAVIPYDLTDALDQIRLVAPPLADLPSFRRLSTVARR